MKLEKRGQLSLFVIIGVLVVAVIGGGFYFHDYSTKKANENYFNSESVRSQVEALKNNLDSCVNDVTLASIYLIGDQGGYYKEPDKYKRLDAETFVPYYYYEGEIVLPKMSEVEMSLSTYVNDYLSECLRFNSDSSFDISSKPKASSSVSPSRVSYDFDGNVVLTSDEGYAMEIDLSDYSAMYNVSLYEIYEVARYLTESHEEDAELYCVSCLVDMLDERDLYLDYLPIESEDNKTIAVVITDKSNDLGQDYYFVYLNKYTGSEVSPIYEEVGSNLLAPAMDEV